jgi:DNA repair photolyase
MIVSASRRTDVPLFFSEWFIQQLKKGRTEIANPYNPQQVRTVSLNPERVDAFVFWTRNPQPFVKALDLIDELNIPYYFLVTINQYPDFLEPHSTDLISLISTLQILKSRIGKSRIIWRYDPIIISAETPVSFHRENFSRLIEMIAPISTKVVVSLIQMYSKVKKRFEEIGFLPYDIGAEKDKFEELLLFLSNTTREHQMNIQGCAQEMTGTGTRIKSGKCIDDDLMNSIFNTEISYQKDRGQRPGCFCHKSIDIGQYGTCRLNCLYCYAR